MRDDSIPEGDREVLRSDHGEVAQEGNVLVQEPVVDLIDDLLPDHLHERVQVEHHARPRIHGATDHDLENVVVSVDRAARSEFGVVLRLVESLGVQPMGSGKFFPVDDLGNGTHGGPE